MARATIGAGMEQADIKEIGAGKRKLDRQIFRYCLLIEPLTMHYYAQILQNQRFRGMVRGPEDIVWQAHILGHVTGGVVIAGNEQDLNARFPQPGHLGREKETGIVILPITVVEVTGNEDERHRFGHGQFYQGFKGLAGRSSDFLHRGSGILLKADEGTIEMNVGCMNKLEHSFTLWVSGTVDLANRDMKSVGQEAC